jgi:RNA 2',3'-cyclic 3'-phosphodiesterase
MPPMPRLFFGLEIPTAIKQRLLKVRSAVSGAKWQVDEQLHITLLFLGSVEEGQLTTVCDWAREIQVEVFSVQVVGLGCFGEPQKPRALWAGVQPVAPMTDLQKALQKRLEKLGFVKENRKFHPHITLARFKREAGSVEALLTEHGEQVFGEFPVTEFVLFDSKPGPTGSVYRVIQRFPLPPHT